jgi:hypothetical protein
VVVQSVRGVNAKPKAFASLTLLVFWEIWNERKERVFHHKDAPQNDHPRWYKEK